MNEIEFKKRILIYKQLHTSEVAPPDCKMCHNRATLYDVQEGENYCDKCLEKSFIGEEDTLKEYTDDIDVSSSRY